MNSTAAHLQRRARHLLLAAPVDSNTALFSTASDEWAISSETVSLNPSKWLEQNTLHGKKGTLELSILRSYRCGEGE
jgi:hypothetical protein